MKTRIENVLHAFERLREVAKMQHVEVDDCWYSCPLAKDLDTGDSASCNEAAIARGKCICGADTHNARVENALAQIVGIIDLE